MAVTRVTIHHEGAGSPVDFPRGGAGGYTYWLGATRWTRLRSAYVSYATLHYNHVSVDICLSGERDTHPVTDNDLRMLREIVADARARGELADLADVFPHRASFLTDCPGQLTMARWPAVHDACLKPIVAVPPPAQPPANHPNEDFDMRLFFDTQSVFPAERAARVDNEGNILVLGGAQIHLADAAHTPVPAIVYDGLHIIPAHYPAGETFVGADRYGPNGFVLVSLQANGNTAGRYYTFNAH